MADAAAVATPENRMGRLAARLAEMRGATRYAVAGLGGAIATTALPPLYFLPALYISFAVLVWLLGGARTWRAAFAIGWWFGFGYFGTGLYWVGNALLVRGDGFAWLLPFVAVGFPAVLALYAGLAASFVYRIVSPLGRGVALALAWTAMEWLRGHLFTGFPWNLFGYAWAGSDALVQSAALFGAYGLSLAATLSCGLAAGLAEPSARRRLSAALLAAAIPLAAWTGGTWRLAGAPASGDATVPGVGLRIVQAGVPQREKWSQDHQRRNFERHVELSIRERPAWVTHVIWAETAATFFIEEEPGIRSILARLVPPEGLLITGAPRRDRAPRRLYNSMVALDSSGEVVATYDKAHLVPFGEYVPLAEYLPIPKIAEGGSGYAPGSGLRTVRLPGAPPASPLICYEVIFPGTVVDRANRPGWLLNLTNDAWYGRTSGPHQHLAISRVRAVEEGLPLVRAAYTGISAVVDAYGRVLSSLPLDQPGVLDAGLPAPLATPPLFARYGNLVFTLLLCTIVAGIVMVRWLRRDRHARGATRGA